MQGMGFRMLGAEGFSGTTEQATNLAIVLKLQNLLEQSGATVILTRSDSNGVYELDKESIRAKKVSDIKNRVYIGNNNDADIYVSIHLNYFEQSKYSGWQTFYQSKSEKSRNLSQVIQVELNNNFDKKNNRKPMAIKDVYIMERIQVPAVIVECGFLSNKEEEILLSKESHQQKIAWGIYMGIQKYFIQN